MTPVESVVQAVLYEGYMLYPYRPSSVKNRQRWTFGGVYPHAYAQASGSDPWLMQNEYLIRGDARTRIDVRPGFLQVIERIVLDAPGSSHASPLSDALAWRQVPVLEIRERRYFPWQEAAERQIRVPQIVLGELLGEPREVPFSFAAGSEIETLGDETRTVRGALRHTRFHLEGRVALAAECVADGAYRLTTRILNDTPLKHVETLTRDQASVYALISCHTILRVKGGECVSLINPPEDLAAAAGRCRNIGAWPVLVGDETRRDTMLASPIILYDYPQIAPESAGALFDSTEIDEILPLRILTMTDDEKREMAATDDRARTLLTRIENMGAQQMQKLHGTFRQLRTAGAPDSLKAPAQDDRFELESPWAGLDASPQLACVRVAGVEVQVGDQVRLHPRCRADIFDIALNGMVATIESIERDFDDRVHVAVTIDDDPGKDLGTARMPGHRFFFGPDEIEPLTDDGRRA